MTSEFVIVRGIVYVMQRDDDYEGELKVSGSELVEEDMLKDLNRRNN